MVDGDGGGAECGGSEGAAVHERAEEVGDAVRVGFGGELKPGAFGRKRCFERTEGEQANPHADKDKARRCDRRLGDLGGWVLANDFGACLGTGWNCATSQRALAIYSACKFQRLGRDASNTGQEWTKGT